MVSRISLLFVLMTCVSGAQSSTTDVQRTDVIVVGLPGQTYPAGTVVIPAHVSETVAVHMDGAGKNDQKGSDSSQTRVASAISTIGLASNKLPPWHLKVAFERFDEDGDKVDEGTFEESWAGAEKDVQTFASDELKHSDYATPNGLFRFGDQRWASRFEIQVRSLIVEPFDRITPVDRFSLSPEKRTYSSKNLECERVVAHFGDFSMPSAYCFEPGSNTLRYRQGPSWDQVTYNDSLDFEGNKIARDVVLTDGGNVRLKLKVITLERLSPVDDAMFVPPAGAVKLGDDILTGVQMKPTHTEFPEWPSSAAGKHFEIVIQLVIGFTGQVESATAISGPQEFYKAAEKTAKKWTFKPYLVQGKPAKVSTRIQLNQN